MQCDAPRPLGAGRVILGVALALAVGVALAVAVAGPDLPQLQRMLPGRPQDDAMGAIYLHHEVHQALIEGRLSMSDPDQLVPVGFQMAAANGANIVEMLVSGLCRLVLPWPAWLSAAAYAWIPLNVLAFLPLGYRLWGRTAPAVAAGAAWAIFPPLLHQLSTLRLTQVVLLGLPLAVAGLLAIAERGGRRAVLQAGVGVALTGIGYWFYGLFIALLSPLFLAWGLRQRPWRPLLRELVAAAGLSLLLVSPFLAQIGLATRRIGGYRGSPISSDWASPDFPDSLRLVGSQPESVVGWLPLALVAGAALTLVQGRRRLLWGGLAGAGLVFAMGPGQRIGDTLWLLPSYPLWKWVPGVDRMSHPDRWLMVTSLFMVVLSMDGLARVPGRVARVILPWLVPAGVLLQLTGSGLLPLGTWDPVVPDVWRDLGEREGGAVITLPLLNAATSAGWQPFHERPLVGGMIEGERGLVPPAWLARLDESELLLSLYALSSGEDVPVIVYQADLDALRADGIDTVVLDQQVWSRHRHLAGVPVRQRVEEALGPPLFDGQQGVSWVLPETGLPGEPPASGRTMAVLPDVPPDGGVGRSRGPPLPTPLTPLPLTPLPLTPLPLTPLPLTPLPPGTP